MLTPHITRDYEARAFTIGISGAAGSGQSTLLLALCRLLRDNYSLAVVTSRVSPAEDDAPAHLSRHKGLPSGRIAVVDRGGSLDLALESLMEEFRPDLLFVEVSGPESKRLGALADFRIHVLDASTDLVSPDALIDAGESDLLVLNKTVLGPPPDVRHHIAARESSRIRGEPGDFTQPRHGVGTIEIARHVLVSWRRATAPAVWTQPPEPVPALSRRRPDRTV